MSGHFWLKLKHGAPANPKWRMIAQTARCPQGEVWTLYSWALDYAGQHNGSLAGFDLEEVAATTDYLLDELQRIWAAFADKAIIAGEQILHWVEHQGQAAVAALSTPRVRKHRAKQRDRRQGEMLLPIPGGGETRNAVSGVSSVSGRVSAGSQTPYETPYETRKTPDISTHETHETHETRETPDLEGDRDREESRTTHSSHSESTRITYTLAEPGKPARPARALFSKNDQKEEAAFEAFYAAYPLKAKRPRAFDAWRRARQTAEIADIMAGLARYRRQKPDWQQWAQPASWLDDQRWTDEGIAGPVERDYIADYAKARHAGQLESPECDYPAPLMAKIKAREMEMFGSIAA